MRNTTHYIHTTFHHQILITIFSTPKCNITTAGLHPGRARPVISDIWQSCGMESAGARIAFTHWTMYLATIQSTLVLMSYSMPPALRGIHELMGTHSGSQTKFVWKTVNLYRILAGVDPHPHMYPARRCGHMGLERIVPSLGCTRGGACADG